MWVGGCYHYVFIHSQHIFFKKLTNLVAGLVGANFISHCRRVVLLDAVHYRDMFVSDTFVRDTFICMLMLSIARLFNVTKNIFDCRKFMWAVDEEPINQ